MNVKQWALFFIVTLGANYVSATFLPFGGSSHGRRRSSYTDCNKHQRGYLSKRIESFRGSFQNKYGRHCSLGSREFDGYKLKNVRARGFENFKLGDRCLCNIDNNGYTYLRFVLTFDEIVAIFLLDIPEAIGGILGDFAETIFGIIGYFVNKFLQIVFPPFLCDVIVTGNYQNGFKLSGFEFLHPEDNIAFRGGLHGHERKFEHYKYLLFRPLKFCISLFLTHDFKPFFGRHIENWEFDEDVFSGSRLDYGRKSGGYRSGQSTRYEESEEEESEIGGGYGGEGYEGEEYKEGGYYSREYTQSSAEQDDKDHY